MSDKPSQRFLQLIKISFDVSTSVVRDFADCKVIGLPEYGGSVIKFLDLKKHDLYHKWQCNVPCCHCRNSFEKYKKEIDKWRFDLLYEIISDRQIVCMNGKGRLMVNGYTEQHCICNMITRQPISLNEMDISTLSLLLRDCNIEKSQLESVQNLNQQRCTLCHAYSTTLSMEGYDDLFKNLKDSTLDLAFQVNPYYHRVIKDQLTNLKSYDITTEETKRLQEMILNEISESQIANSNMISSGMNTLVSKFEEAKHEMIQNQQTQLAEIREQIQQLTATVVFMVQKTGKADDQYKTSDEYKDKTDMKKVTATLPTENDSTRMDGNSVEVNDEQLIQLNMEPKDISQIRATCLVEGKDIDECSAVKSLSDTMKNPSKDFSFNIISAEQKCILLQMNVPLNVLEDRVLLRVALRALIVKIAHAGKVDTNKQSTMTLHLSFKDDLTEDIKREIQEISNNSTFSCMIDRRLNSDQHISNEDWWKKKCAWLENENATLMLENSRLLKEAFAHDGETSNLKIELGSHQQVKDLINAPSKASGEMIDVAVQWERRIESPWDSGSESLISDQEGEDDILYFTDMIEEEETVTNKELGIHDIGDI